MEVTKDWLKNVLSIVEAMDGELDAIGYDHRHFIRRDAKNLKEEIREMLKEEK